MKASSWERITQARKGFSHIGHLPSAHDLSLFSTSPPAAFPHSSRKTGNKKNICFCSPQLQPGGIVSLTEARCAMHVLGRLPKAGTSRFGSLMG